MQTNTRGTFTEGGYISYSQQTANYLKSGPPKPHVTWEDVWPYLILIAVGISAAIRLGFIIGAMIAEGGL